MIDQLKQQNISTYVIDYNIDGADAAAMNDFARRGGTHRVAEQRVDALG